MKSSGRKIPTKNKVVINTSEIEFIPLIDNLFDFDKASCYNKLHIDIIKVSELLEKDRIVSVFSARRAYENTFGKGDTITDDLGDYPSDTLITRPSMEKSAFIDPRRLTGSLLADFHTCRNLDLEPPDEESQDLHVLLKPLPPQ